MSRADSYIREIQSLDGEIKRLNSHLKKLREQKKKAQGHLYSYMKRRNLEKCGKYTIKSVTPRPSKPRKPESAKKADAIELFRQVGIPDPAAFFVEFKATQRYQDSEQTQPPNTGQKYDPYLE